MLLLPRYFTYNPRIWGKKVLLSLGSESKALDPSNVIVYWPYWVLASMRRCDTYLIFNKNMWRQGESTPGPSDYKSDALSIALSWLDGKSCNLNSISTHGPSQWSCCRAGRSRVALFSASPTPKTTPRATGRRGSSFIDCRERLSPQVAVVASPEIKTTRRDPKYDKFRAKIKKKLWFFFYFWTTIEYDRKQICW